MTSETINFGVTFPKHNAACDGRRPQVWRGTGPFDAVGNFFKTQNQGTGGVGQPNRQAPRGDVYHLLTEKTKVQLLPNGIILTIGDLWLQERKEIINNSYIVWKLVDFLNGSIHGAGVKELLKRDNLLWEKLEPRLKESDNIERQSS